MKLTEEILKSFECLKCFKDNNDKINSLNFTSNGEKLLTSSYDDSVNVYDALNGKHMQTIYSKKYGVDLARFTHCPSAILHASTKCDDTLRYLSLHDNKYLRFYSGHSKRVISLMMSPKDDSFLSGSLDKSIRLWDLRTPNCQAVMNLSGRGLAAIDPEGLIFCANVSNDTCKLYDLRTYEQGPFLTFTIPGVLGNNSEVPNKIETHSVRFSPDGKMILITTNGTQIFLVDSYTGKSMHHYQILGTNPGQAGINACFSADSRFVLAGCPEGRVYAWRLSGPGMLPVATAGSTAARSVCAVLQSSEGGTSHGGASGMSGSGSGTPLNVGALEANPVYAMLALGQIQTSLWMPITGQTNTETEPSVSSVLTSAVGSVTSIDIAE